MSRRNRTFRIILVPLGVLLYGLGCNFAGASSGGVTVVVVPADTSAPEPPAFGTAPCPAATETQTAAPTALPTATATVAHLTTPPGAAGITRFITDPETRDYAPQKKAPSGADVFSINRYERPYTAGTMEYLPDVDLVRAELKIAAPWVYVTFELSGTRAEGIGRTVYGAEFDTDRDGRGEFLVWGVSPAGDMWTTDGVEVWSDPNSDVGGARPQTSDAPSPAVNGYDRKLFAGGQGADPDLAWIRQVDGGSKVQLALKYSAIDNASQFLWNGLADVGIRKPDWFDYNDHFTAAEAGSPYPVQADLYPLRQLAGVDNTCRDAYGFTPTGSEPGLCLYYGSIRGVVAWDIDHSGSLDATELSIALISGDTVTLGTGGCPSTGHASAVTDSEGRYSFPDLPIGRYCVGVIHTVPNPISVPSATVHLAPGQEIALNFPVPW